MAGEYPRPRHNRDHMSYSNVTRQELFNACHLLFGRETSASAGFLEYLKLSGVKSAYRKKALETHPDRSAALFGNTREMEERFKAVNDAYKQLIFYVENPSRFKARHAGVHSPVKPRPHRPQAAAERRPAGNRGRSLPAMKLALGRFLYYSGAISHENLIAAVIWQRMQHVLVGRIALKSGWLREKDIQDVMKHRLPDEKFGECAVRRGVLTRRQLDTALHEQKLPKPLFGTYFTGRKILTHQELNSYLVMQYIHNKKHGL